MFKPILLTEDAFKQIVGDLLKLEERIHQLNEFFPSQHKEAEAMKHLIRKYIGCMDESLLNMQVVKFSANDFPFVILSSDVTMVNTKNSETLQIKLISPFKTNAKFGEISLLSPMGKALLFKKVSDEVMVNMPAGGIRYRIISIKIGNEIQ